MTGTRIYGGVERPGEHAEACRCADCEHEREALERALFARRRTDPAPGGISAFGHEVLGPGWLGDDEGERMADVISTEALAQRALGDVFEQLERIGTVGREKCRGKTWYEPDAVTPVLARHEALALIRFAENALDYARVHLDYLARDSSANPRGLRPGDVVRVGEADRCKVLRLGDDSDGDNVQVEWPDGTVGWVDVRDVRESAA